MRNTDRRYQTPATRPILAPRPTPAPGTLAPAAPPVRVFGARRWAVRTDNVSFSWLRNSASRW